VSVLDQFRDAEQRVAQRLKELEPAVAEYRELEEVAQRLGIDVSSTAPARAARTRRRKASAAPAKANGASAPAPGRRRTAPVKAASATPTARGRRRKARGRRDEQLLALVRERPGLTVAEAGKAMSVDPTGLYRVVSRLEQRGDVRKNGRALEPTTAASSK
jgi:hypothetical protein